MDQKLEKNAWFTISKKHLVVVVSALLIVVGYILQTPTVSPDDLVLAGVKNGDIGSSTTGVGKIESQKKWLISANETGNLLQVLKNVGDSVAQGEVILRLGNDKLSRLQTALQQDIELLETELTSIRLRLKAAQSERRNRAKKAELTVKTTELELAAIGELAKKGIVSKLKFSLAQAKADEARFDLELSKELQHSSRQLANAEIALMQGKIKRKQGELQNIKTRIDSLAIRSPITGVLQFVSEKYGSKINEGEELASVSDTQYMKASFILPEQDSSFVYLDKPLVLTTSQGQLAAKVSLIKPAIKNGAIEVEARLTEKQPSWVKPDLPLQAMITGNSLYTGLYVKKPVRVSHNAEATVYRMDKKAQVLRPVLVSFGRQIGQYVTIESGLTAGDLIVVSSQAPLSGQSINVSK